MGKTKNIIIILLFVLIGFFIIYFVFEEEIKNITGKAIGRSNLVGTENINNNIQENLEENNIPIRRNLDDEIIDGKEIPSGNRCDCLCVNLNSLASQEIMSLEARDSKNDEECNAFYFSRTCELSEQPIGEIVSCTYFVKEDVVTSGIDSLVSGIKRILHFR